MHRTPQRSGPAQSGLGDASSRVRRQLVSMRARLVPARLDQELAAGVEPGRDPLLRERARHLLSRDSRLKMAAGLGRTLHQVERPTLHTTQVPVRSNAVRDAAPALEMLACRLRGSLPIAPQGAAKTKILLSDGGGPLYNPGSASDLKMAARQALTALEVDSGDRQRLAKSPELDPPHSPVARGPR